MAVALVDGGIGGEAIEVALTFDVVNPNALSAIDDNVEGMIVVSSVFFFELDEILGLQAIHYRHCMSPVGIKRFEGTGSLTPP